MNYKCWNCNWFNGNEQPCDQFLNEENCKSTDDICGSFKLNKSFLEEVGKSNE